MSKLRTKLSKWFLDTAKKHYASTVELDACIDWLKSLKDRYVWKPSEEQIIALRWILNNIPYCTHKEVISGLLDQIKETDREVVAKNYAEFVDEHLQNRWKPSDEQVKALEDFVRSIGESGYASPYDNNTKLLYSLLNDLKKLKA